MTNQEKLGYVVRQERYDGRFGPEIDLGLGTSPIGPAPELHQPLKDRDPYFELSRYSEDPLHVATRQLIVDALGLKGVDYQAIVFDGNGSYGAGDEVIRYLTLRGFHPVYVSSYSFPNVSQWVERHGNSYLPIVDLINLHPSSSWQKILESEDSKFNNAIVYLDYPNNPFGYTNLYLLKEIILKVGRSGGVALVDLAFGEVLGDEFNQIIQMTVDHGGVALCSLSKTQGLPGLRTGYAIMSNRFLDDGYNGGQRLVFGLNREAEFVYQLLFTKGKDGNYLARIHAERVARYNIETNQLFYDGLSRLGLTVALTDLKTSIQVIISNLPDFYQRLSYVGIRSESLADYKVTLGGKEGYSDSAVRLLTPPPGMVDEVLRRIEIAINL
jgi:histidinol-phosphate/aromatic aminotransferase/cobyric acid decarboxylase-like protein